MDSCHSTERTSRTELALNQNKTPGRPVQPRAFGTGLFSFVSTFTFDRTGFSLCPCWRANNFLHAHLTPAPSLPPPHTQASAAGWVCRYTRCFIYIYFCQSFAIKRHRETPEVIKLRKEMGGAGQLDQKENIMEERTTECRLHSVIEQVAGNTQRRL